MGRIDILETTLNKYQSKLPDSPEEKYHIHPGGNLESRIIVIVSVHIEQTSNIKYVSGAVMCKREF